MTETRIKYEPEAVTAPGETLSDLLEKRGMTQSELAQRMGRPPKTISLIVNGKAAITPETALELQRVLETPAAYWLNHDANYRAYLARQQEEEQLEDWRDWLDQFPVNELKRLGHLPDLYSRGRNKIILVRALLEFFGVNSPTQWEAVYGGLQLAFRQSKPDRSDPFSTAAWLRLGEIQAFDAPSARFDRSAFEEALQEIRSLTVRSPEEFEPELKRLCAESGVILALVPAIPHASVSGAARWINYRTLIQLSLFGKKNDRFWFTFFHEACHLLRHSNKLVFLDDWSDSDPSEEEQEADRFAAEMLIPRRYDKELAALDCEATIVEFASQIDIHPGIVVGRLQHDGLISYSEFNNLKATYRLGGRK